MTDAVAESPSAPAPAPEPLLVATGLVKEFPIRGGFWQRQVASVSAVSGVDVAVDKGQTLGLVGESGCGKSTTARMLLRLIEPTAGSIRFRGQEITTMGSREMRRLRRHMQLVFQDPYASLNPRLSVGQIVAEPLKIHGLSEGRDEKVASLMDRVGLKPEHMNRFPHEFSGGQRQRVGIARALALDPELIVLDEPVSALDVSIQAQILNLLHDLQGEFGLTYLFIAHDLAVIRHISTRVAVMYLGVIVEIAGSGVLYDEPLHPYTRALLSAVPIPDPAVERKRQRIILEGDVPSPDKQRTGCYFYDRCAQRMDVCRDHIPALTEVKPDHRVACFLYFKP